MNLYEYQAKSILRKYNVPVAMGLTADTEEEALVCAQEIKREKLAGKWVVKAQVLAGGRGKAGGIKVADSLADLRDKASRIIGMKLVTPQTPPEGIEVKKVLIEEFVYGKGENPIRELYLSILMNRDTSENIIMYSPEGGMDIEQVAKDNPERVFRETLDSENGLNSFQCRKIAFNLGISGVAVKRFEVFLRSLYSSYIQSDATLLEINPLLKTSDEQFFAVDTKMTIDDNALLRHSEFLEFANDLNMAPVEKLAREYRLNYIKLDGNVGCMVNGAGLAMATMDIIKLAGGEPANFLDIGGSANSENVEQAFRIILKDKNVKVIFVNIFGGIVRCDRVANGIAEACNKIGTIDIPIVLRLEGNNAEAACEIIEKSGLDVDLVHHLGDAANLVIEKLQQ